MLGVSKRRWNNIRTTIRHNAQAARFNYSKDLRNQNGKKFIKLCNASAEVHPELNRFENHWGIERIAKEYFRAHKTYLNCVKNPNSYRGKNAPRRSTTPPSDPPSPASPVQEDDMMYDEAMVIDTAIGYEDDQPEAGPSQPRAPRIPRRVVDSDAGETEMEDDEDVDDEDVEDEDVEDEEMMDPKGKGKARAKPAAQERNRRTR